MTETTAAPTSPDPVAAPPGTDGAIAEALAQASLCGAFQATAAAHPDRIALRDFGTDETWTYAAYREQVRAVATGLHALGVRAGDAVALMLENRSVFHVVDLAVMHLGAVPFSIYNTNPPPRILPVFESARPTVLVGQASFAATILEVQRQDPRLEHVVLVDGDVEGTRSLAEIEALPADPDFDFEAAWRAIGPDDTAAIIFTSGTTGDPKGAEWSHGALLDNVRGLHHLAPVSPGGRVVSYLPMAHLAERFISHYGSLGFGYDVLSLADPKQLGAALAEHRPTRFFGVPRIYEKLAGGARAIIGSDPELAAAFAAAEEQAAEKRRAGTPIRIDDPRPEALGVVAQKLGLDETEWRNSAAAPARVDILDLFAAIGLPVSEIWGMSETALSLMTPPDDLRAGSVGLPTPGFEVTRAPDGEMLLKGPIFSRYRNLPEKTAEAFDADGWFATGDVIEIDDGGMITIVDRKKEILVNSAGKNIPPAMVENRVKQQSPLIGQVVALCDRQPYLTALVVLDEEALGPFRAEHGIEGDLAATVAHAAVVAEIEGAIARANETLARIETVRKHTVLPVHWTPGDPELTNTQKLRRKVIAERFATEIDALFA